MKNIGIMTFHRSHNCGSIMQAYALQRVLAKRYSVKAECIDFSSPGQQKLYSIFNGEMTAKGVLRNAVRASIYNRLKENANSYDKYIKRMIIMSPRKFHSQADLNNARFTYDAYITGSDQVWNIAIADYDPAYFLNFVKGAALKIAYAASFGARRITKETGNPDEIGAMIRDIDAISVREPNGKTWLQEDFGIESTVVLDPTLLLDSIDYTDAEETVRGQTADFLFVYATSVSKKFERQIQHLANKEGLKVVIWQPDTWLKLGGFAKGYILPKAENPGKYLWYIKHARYVFTASFHGVIFCAQYRKNFWILRNQGMDYQRDDRILSLVDRLGLSDRLLSEDNTTELDTPTTYEEFERELAKHRRKSFQFLDRAMRRV